MTECVVVDEDKQRRDEVVVSDKGFGVGEREMLGKRKIEKERKKMVIDNQQSMTESVVVDRDKQQGGGVVADNR